MSTGEGGELDRFAEASIAQGSKSFAAAARLFDGATRRDVMRLYSWCRHCDDVVDGQEGGQGHVASPEPPEARIAGLRRDTARALAGEANGLPLSFRALGAVARRHAMPASLFEEHLNGFALDVEGRRYETLHELLTYCWHVAGVVGVMMARVMGARDEAVLDRAADLGLAFQLTNIARDVVADAGEGRVYLPLSWLREEGLSPDDLLDPAKADAVARLRARLVSAAEPYYASARIGIDHLPRRSAWAIATAALVYRRIGLKLVARGPAAHGIRISTSGPEKLAAIVSGARIAFAPRRPGGPARDRALWQRPTMSLHSAAM
ncbi:phytoene synthase [Aureimonas ureilytica]|uniref:Phytoene synthase n=1 Tax=Aureimonas ureilytica TaxID=401562 RepID=A0A175RT03_9HYPH|nr:phytoene/squalene synthase family protein [Aureimonas ureilytica]KTR05942.1 phytoene synthase [Aureimonas ureilytica]